MGVDVARVHPLVEQVDRLALARTVDAADHDQNGEALQRSKLDLGLQQRGPQRGLAPTVLLAVDAMANLGGFEHAALLCSRAALPADCDVKPAAPPDAQSRSGDIATRSDVSPPDSRSR